MHRRDLLKGLGAMAGAAALPKLGGCGDSEPQGITTIVTVMMENRSYDHYLGARSLLEGLPGNGLTAGMTNPEPDGTLVEAYPATQLVVQEDPPHSWASTHRQWNSGANDGFMREYRARYGMRAAPHPMSYLTRDQLPFTYALADAGAVCDAWHCSLLCGTWPNRMYLHAGTSDGIKVNELPSSGLRFPTIHHTLNDAGIPWAYYYQDLPFVPLFKDLEIDGLVRRFAPDFFDDAAAGTLPPVVFVEPSFTSNDDHPPHHPILGQQFLSSVYTALANSPQWNNCLLVVTYDEHGGFFDHVPPPSVADDRPEEFGRLGVRVPTVVAGPYVKPGHTSSVTRDHTSVLAHIESMFDLPPLTARDAAANDLWELIDTDRLARNEPNPPVAPPAIEINESMVWNAVHRRQSAPVDLELALDVGQLPRHWDRRGEVEATLHTIGDALDRWGAGRIRRGR